MLLTGLALAGTAMPAFLNYLLIRRSGATNASLAMFFLSVFALLLGRRSCKNPFASAQSQG